jgi:hypothetical protein
VKEIADGISFNINAVSLSVNAVTVIGFIVWFATWKATITLKVDTIWGFLVDRAKSETVTRGWGSQNSPIIVNDDAMRLLEPIREAIVKLYRELKPDSDEEFMLLLQQSLREEMLEKVCIPNGMVWGACLVIACAVAKKWTANTTPDPPPPTKKGSVI